MLLALSILATTAFGYVAPLIAQRETIDRVENGVEERSYIVMFNEKAPQFEFQAHDKLKSWLPSVMPEVNVDNVQHVYHIDEGFRGFAVWANFAALQNIMSYEGVRYVEEDQVMRAYAPFTDRADWGQTRCAQRARNLNTTGSGNYTGTTYPNAGADTTVWDWTATVKNGYRLINAGGSVKIWVVDTGVLQSHSEFNASGRSRVSTSQDYVTSGGSGTDCNGHGSHCAGSAAGRYRGLSVNADIGNVRVLNCQGSGTNANVVAGFNYVTTNRDRTKAANILSASLGGGASTATDDAINSAANNQVIPVVAAGNDNANACNYSPARATGAITVGATQSSDTRSTFSNFGTCVDVFSPGQSIHSAWYTSATTYNTISGTSMATPLVAGALGLWATSVGGTQTRATAIAAIRNFGVSGVVGNPGTGSPNLMINANWA
jgi:serine protease